jgi:hypothetical protein
VLLLKRAFLAQIRNPTDVTGRLLLCSWVGILAGLVHHRKLTWMSRYSLEYGEMKRHIEIK